MVTTFELPFHRHLKAHLVPFKVLNKVPSDEPAVFDDRHDQMRLHLHSSDASFGPQPVPAVDFAEPALPQPGQYFAFNQGWNIPVGMSLLQHARSDHPDEPALLTG